MPACVVERHAGQRQPEFDSDSDDETPSPSHSGMDDEEDEGDYDEGCDVEDASFGYASTQRTLTDQPDAVSDMAVSQLGATMSQLKVYAGPADGMEVCGLAAIRAEVGSIHVLQHDQLSCRLCVVVQKCTTRQGKVQPDTQCSPYAA